jgi:hypothetical protein
VTEDIVHQAGPVHPAAGQAVIVQADDFDARITGYGFDEPPNIFVGFGAEYVKDSFHILTSDRATASTGAHGCLFSDSAMVVQGG